LFYEEQLLKLIEDLLAIEIKMASILAIRRGCLSVMGLRIIALVLGCTLCCMMDFQCGTHFSYFRLIGKDVKHVSKHQVS
jgi:hypothetical protein